jgi:signal transduction histidine kinase
VIRCRERRAPAETMRAHARDTKRARTHAPGQTSPRAVEERRLSRARLSGAAQERRRVARDLHDGVQNELVSLILGLSLAEDDPNTPPESGDAGNDHGQPRRRRSAQQRQRRGGGVLACPEALQNVAKHASRSASVTLRLRYRDGRLAVRIEDDGGGFVQIRGSERAGLTNIRDRLASVGGKAKITSTPGQGTVVAVRLPWPARAAATTPVRPVSVSIASVTSRD